MKEVVFLPMSCCFIAFFIRLIKSNIELVAAGSVNIH